MSKLPAISIGEAQGCAHRVLERSPAEQQRGYELAKRHISEQLSAAKSRSEQLSDDLLRTGAECVIAEESGQTKDVELWGIMAAGIGHEQLQATAEVSSLERRLTVAEEHCARFMSPSLGSVKASARKMVQK